MGDRYDLLQPSAVEATLRSLPRRFRHVLGELPGDPGDRERLLTLTSAGRQAVAALTGVVPALAAAEENVRRIAHRSEPQVVEPDRPPTLAWDAVAAEADRVAGAAERLADQLRALPARDWGRTAPTPGGAVTPLDVARGAVRVAVEALRTIERSLGVEAS